MMRNLRVRGEHREYQRNRPVAKQPKELPSSRTLALKTLSGALFSLSNPLGRSVFSALFAEVLSFSINGYSALIEFSTTTTLHQEAVSDGCHEL